MSDFTVETVQTAVGICHKVMPVKACLYVDNAHIDRWQGSKTAMEAFAVAKLFAASPDLLEACKALDAWGRWFDDRTRDNAVALRDALKRIGCVNVSLETSLKDIVEFQRAAIKKATQ